MAARNGHERMTRSRIALCHEWITTFGGSEQVAQRIAAVLGVRDVYTFAARAALARELFPDQRVHVHPWGSGRWGREHWRRLLPVMPYAWSHLELDRYDAVVTSAHSCVNAIRLPESVPLISYCHTPMRYAWQWRSELGRVPIPLRPLWPAVASWFRRADRRWARNVTRFIVNSRHVADRLRDAYGREADVVYPPVDTTYWTPAEDRARSDAFLVAGRLVAYKRVDVAIRAADAAGVRLVVAGGGPELRRLRRAASPNIRFVVDPSREDLRELYRRARAVVNPGVEDFGMTMVEAQACATPILAFARGGATEAVVDGVTGTLYTDPRPEALAAALRSFDPEVYDATAIRAQALQFDAARFDEEIARIVGEVLRS
jgi:glycosyltransferase involved in cell wall biosynthesis